MCLCVVGKAVEMNKQRSPKQLSHSQPTFGIPEQSDSSAVNPGRIRGNQPSEGSDTSGHVLSSNTSPTHSSPIGLASDTSGQDSDSSKKFPRLFLTTLSGSLGTKCLKMSVYPLFSLLHRCVSILHPAQTERGSAVRRPAGQRLQPHQHSV